jgi:transcriptional regulator with GAF, ATPase, and Fis domain
MPADGGVIFLDEIADLPMAAQVKLLRALAEGEFQPIGAKRGVRVNVRVIAATNRPLERLIVAREFRDDLYFRLRYFPLEIPPLRRRGEDWLLLKDYFLQKLAAEYHLQKDFSEASLALLRNYQWPGNVRELKSIVTVGYSLSEGDLIEPEDFSAELRSEWSGGGVADSTSIYRRMAEHGESFWDVVYEPFMDRELNRNQVRSVVRKGLLQSHESYKKLMKIFHIDEKDYHRFMDFLRHHRLKSENPE